MGNTPSTPPPLVSINAPGNHVMVPRGTGLYACPPRIPGYCPFRPQLGSGDCKGSKCQYCQRGRGCILRGPVYSRVNARPRKRHGYAETDVNIREYEAEGGSSSTELGEMFGAVRVKERKSNMKNLRGFEKEGKDMRTFRGRRRTPGPCDLDPRMYGGGARPGSAPAGYAGLRGGQEYPNMGNMARDGVSYSHPGMHPSMYHPGMLQPGMSPHAVIPPQHASHNSIMGYPPGASAMHVANPYASRSPRSPRPSPPGASSLSPSPKSPSHRLPPKVQAAIGVAVQNSAEVASKSRSKPDHTKTSPAIHVTRKHMSTSGDGWGDGIDTCTCTTNCKCRKGERATGWYEGVVDIEGERVPFKGKLNTRWVLANDLSKDCRDHRACNKSTSSSSSSSSSSSDTEASASKHGKKSKGKKNAKKERDDRLDALKSEIDKTKEAGATLQGGTPYLPSPFAGYDPELSPNMLEHMERLRMAKTDGISYGMSRVVGMNATDRTQGIYDFMTTRNDRSPRMPPKPDGMQMRSGDDGDWEDIGGASLGNPYAQPRTFSGKGRHSHPSRSKSRAGLGFRREGRKCVSETDSESKSSSRGGVRKNNRQAWIGRFRPHFELGDTDASLRPGKQSRIGKKNSSEESAAEMYNSSKHSSGERDEESPLRTGQPRISPPERRGGARLGRAVGRQARVETDDDEDY